MGTGMANHSEHSRPRIYFARAVDGMSLDDTLALAQTVRAELAAFGLTLVDPVDEHLKIRSVPEGDAKNASRRLVDFDLAILRTWLCSSLVHLPSTFIEEILLCVRKLLRREGVVFASIINGSHSGWQPDPFGGRRWFAQLREEEALELVSRVGLALIKSSIEPGVLSGTWINLLARREE